MSWGIELRAASDDLIGSYTAPTVPRLGEYVWLRNASGKSRSFIVTDVAYNAPDQWDGFEIAASTAVIYVKPAKK